ncbi:hypothetical protein [Jiangella muralis]|uniref:hypothetical protein n=1 Tax=Jiangella muralis TaxID=702383 RepID=UPI00069F2811|nr:hypothetical protein [Jiangella muralis]
MSQTIEIESIARLDIKPGEILIATLPEGLDDQQVDAFGRALRAALPEQVRCLVVTGGVAFHVAASEEVPA